MSEKEHGRILIQKYLEFNQKAYGLLLIYKNKCLVSCYTRKDICLAYYYRKDVLLVFGRERYLAGFDEHVNKCIEYIDAFVQLESGFILAEVLRQFQAQRFQLLHVMDQS